MDNRYREFFAKKDPVRVLKPAVLKLVYDDGDLRVHGLDREGALMIELRFTAVLLTRVVPEDVRLGPQPKLGKNDSWVLIDQQSELVPWLREECLHTRELTEARHFLLFVGEEIVDVVALSDPEISKRGA
jgi:hypothetical protein